MGDDDLIKRIGEAFDSIKDTVKNHFNIINGSKKPQCPCRHEIMPDSPIDQGAYFREGMRWRIVVDGKNHTSGHITQMYDYAGFKILRNMTPEEAVYKAALKVFKNKDDESVANLEKKLYDDYNAKYKGKIPGKVSLEVYMVNRTGDSVHMALLASEILERLVSNEFAKGSVSFDDMTTEDNKIMAWCRYTKEDNSIVIIDSYNNYLGPLKEPYLRLKDRNKNL